MDQFPIFIYISTPVIPNYWNLKVNYLGPENLLSDISSLERMLSCQELDVFTKVGHLTNIFVMSEYLG